MRRGAAPPQRPLPRQPQRLQPRILILLVPYVVADQCANRADGVGLRQRQHGRVHIGTASLGLKGALEEVLSVVKAHGGQWTHGQRRGSEMHGGLLIAEPGGVALGVGVPSSAVMNCGLAGCRNSGLQPDTMHRAMVVRATIDAVDMESVRRNMQRIVLESESHVSTGFGGGG